MILTDFKSSPFPIYNNGNLGNPNYTGTATALYNGYTGTGLNSIPDYSLDTLLNSKWNTDQGQTLTLVSCAATTIVGGVNCQGPAQITAFEKLSMTVPTATPATAGTFQILVTNGSTVLKQNLFAGGWLVTASGTGIGQTLTIASHAGGANAGTFLVTLVDPIQVTLDATTTVSLIANPAKNIIIAPASIPTGSPIGVTLYAIPASVAPTWNGTTGALSTSGTPQYGFVVSHGMVGCLIDTTTAIGAMIGPSTGTAGALVVAILASLPAIAINAQTQTNAQVGMVYMML